MKAHKETLIQLLDKYYCHHLYDLYDHLTDTIHDRLEFPEGLHIWHSLTDDQKIGYYLSITDEEVKQFEHRLLHIYAALN